MGENFRQENLRPYKKAGNSHSVLINHAHNKEERAEKIGKILGAGETIAVRPSPSRAEIEAAPLEKEKFPQKKERSIDLK